ncbi:N-methyl-L-tryptophan oxidase [Mesorhizobium sp. LHD-90]|uniref:N-methyl-L-tryptophan oxidase n=1 Tax=Mesorhizobium sp. LHD-90 TaxID=3071414 RepID=UPI0027DEE1EE|nr:N-methyl-L-tryptophan oxidase [Mesorhizobium sp. LHD-90]MDQ6433048.1 N-methyl-L-tryptophan oxidase [Mesorhizobium sp. LHD-90]
MRNKTSDGNYDVAVIGLGAMGSAALFHLARRGVKAVGIEQFQPGHDRGSSHGESRAIRLGYFEHPSYVPLVRRAYENWRELEQLTGETVLTVTGILEAGKPGGILVSGSLEACRLHGLDHELLDPAEVARRFPAIRLPNDYSAMFQPQGGFVRPDLANALHLGLATKAGATILADTKVLAIEPRGAGVRVVLADRAIEVGSVVVATGPWITELVPELRPRLFLNRMVLTWYEPKRPELFGLGALPVFAIEGEDDFAYGFPDFAGLGFKCASHFGSGRLATADDARQDAGPADEARTRRFLERYLPDGAGRLKAMKTCIYTMTPDEDFVIDTLPDDPRIVVASPCSGHGFKFASVVGEVVADLATTGETTRDIGRFRMGRWGSATAYPPP